MNDGARLNRIQTDLQRASTVLYLEGVTDPLVLFSLLGLTRPAGDIHSDVYVVGLKDGGSGGKEVRALVDVAACNGLGGILGSGGIFGIVDGDGRDLYMLRPEFDDPHAGPLFSWKAYCIENLLARVTWPTDWGDEPNWQSEIGNYAPYVALNRVQRELRSALETLGLAKFTNPQLGQALLSEREVRDALEKDKNLITDRDVAQMFTNEVYAFRAALAASLDEAHTWLNGKWLVRHLAPSRTKRSADKCRSDWAAAVRGAGGLGEVHELWQRITGSAP